MWIKVTNLDIKRGVQLTTDRCPVARAVRRRSGTRRISVASDYCMVGSRQYDLPDEVGAFIRRFDKGQRVAPLTFRMRRHA